jgi:hypothetical protein
MASLLIVAIALAAALGLLLGAFLAISSAIRREDRNGTLTGAAPSLACRSARHIVGWHRFRWEHAGPRTPVSPGARRA